MTKDMAPEVANFLRLQEDMSIPPEALVDPAASASYLARMRAPRPALERIPDEVQHVEDLTVGPTGTKVRLYRPVLEDSQPVIIFLHGGGWVVGSVDGYDALSRRLATATGCLVLSVDYRLAPEHPYPAGLDDVSAVLAWAQENVARFGGDPDRLALVGTSAGGNLAAAAALRARDEVGPSIALQVLLYPVLDSAMSGASFEENARGYSLERDLMRWFWDQYVPDRAARQDPYASPGNVTDLAGLPPAIIVTTGLDPLRDEGEDYARRLQEAGVPTTSDRYDGQIHGFLNFIDIWSDADRAMAKLAQDIRTALGIDVSESTGPLGWTNEVPS